MLRIVIWAISFASVGLACSDAAETTGTTKGRGGSTATTTTEAEGGSSAQGGAPATGGVAETLAGAAGQAPVAFGPLGLRCSATEPCAKSLSCFAAAGTDFGAVSPAGGFCSIRCAADSDCQAIDPSAHCAELLVHDGTPPSICVPSCTLGDNKACGGRDDVACWPLGDGGTTTTKRGCLPTCNHDDQCPAGTVCDGWLNLCSSVAPSGGLPLGSDCNPSALPDSCAEGFCIELDGAGACSAYCRRGTFPQCGGNGESSTCGWVFPGDEAAGAADIGMCANTCACDADCATGSHCVLHPDRAGMTKPGICTVGASVGIEGCL